MTNRLPFDSNSFDIGVHIIAARIHARNAASLLAIGDPKQPLPLTAAATMTGQGALHATATVLHASVMSPDKPSKFADFCLSLFLGSAKSEGIIGDLWERFDRDQQRYGAQRARLNYLGGALYSLGAIAKRVFDRMIKWGVVLELVRRFFNGH
jgi:hypothetical protein